MSSTGYVSGVGQDSDNALAFLGLGLAIEFAPLKLFDLDAGVFCERNYLLHLRSDLDTVSYQEAIDVALGAQSFQHRASSLDGVGVHVAGSGVSAHGRIVVAAMGP